MNLTIRDDNLPGSAIKKSEGESINGEAFLDRIFFITDGIMLSEIKKISGLDGSTLQNWVKRGWIGNTVNRKYSKNQLARILIINMMRSTVSLEKIDFILKYINGRIDFEGDDIIPEARLYGYICTVTDRLCGEDAIDEVGLDVIIEATLTDYSREHPRTEERLKCALKFIISAYFASLAKGRAGELLVEIEAKNAQNEVSI